MTEHRRHLTIAGLGASRTAPWFEVSRRQAIWMSRMALVVLFASVVLGLLIALAIPLPEGTPLVTDTAPNPPLKRSNGTGPQSSPTDERSLAERQARAEQRDDHQDAAIEDIRHQIAANREALEQTARALAELNFYVALGAKALTFLGTVASGVLVGVMVLLAQRFARVREPA